MIARRQAIKLMPVAGGRALQHEGKRAAWYDEPLRRVNYRATTHLLVPGMVFEEGDVPRLLESDVCGYLGDIRAMIADYIQNVKGGRITPECNGNWSIVGFEWDEQLQQRAVELVASGALELEVDDKHLPSHAITEDDVRGAHGGASDIA